MVGGVGDRGEEGRSGGIEVSYKWGREGKGGVGSRIRGAGRVSAKEVSGEEVRERGLSAKAK